MNQAHFPAMHSPTFRVIKDSVKAKGPDTQEIEIVMQYTPGKPERGTRMEWKFN